MDANAKLGLLRNQMAEHRIDGYIVSNSDPHFNEYLPDRYRQIKWLTGFSGSNALVYVTLYNAYLWTDGRYFVQAKKELDGSEFVMMKMGYPNEPDIYEVIKKSLVNAKTLGFDGSIMSQAEFEKLKKIADEMELKISDEYDLIGKIWKDRPQIAKGEAFKLDTKYAGKSAAEKIEDIRKEMRKKEIYATVISSLDDIAWTFNIRGSDIANNPVVTSYAIIDQNHAELFIDENKVSLNILDHLNDNKIDRLKYEDIFARANNIVDKKVLVDKKTTSSTLYKYLEKNNKIIDDKNISTYLKSIKNDIEIENEKNAYIKDGVSLVKFIYWLKHHGNIEEETEYTISEKLLGYRKENDLFKEPSFNTIAAYKENAAMMHYSATEQSAKSLENEGFLLVDSGAQYLDGTTDITRTIAMGPLTDEMKKDFTLTLIGHLDLVDTIFLAGTTGRELDAICRRPLWRNFSDYKCGTGHGIGFYLNVHEGPQSISKGKVEAPILPGMITSNEPGVYKEGKYGIRTENIMLTKEVGESDDGKFYGFEFISFVPIDIDAIDVSLMDDYHKNLLNDYHEKTYQKLQEFLEPEVRNWLREVTRPI